MLAPGPSIDSESIVRHCVDDMLDRIAVDAAAAATVPVVDDIATVGVNAALIDESDSPDKTVYMEPCRSSLLNLDPTVLKQIRNTHDISTTSTEPSAKTPTFAELLAGLV